MTTFAEIFKADSITAAWFWIDSISVGPYAEQEKFDAVFTRGTGYIVGTGYTQRRTLYVQGIVTTRSMSRRENGGRIVRPDALEVLADVIVDAHATGQYANFKEWASGHRDMSLGYRDALQDFEDWEIQRALHRQIVAWLGDDYDAYVKAAEAYLADH